ncbi:NAD-dependent epimerase/dehydratase family protein [Nonomuraea ferruginea]
MVKLSNNCHTDVIYAFGNELALIAEQHGLDPLEVIRATNLDYPRPDLAKPGYVGGGCLTKDPYLMLASMSRRPYLVSRARALNESLPGHVAERVVGLVREEFGRTEGVRLSVLGWAYKGWPATDDMRGTPIADMMPVFTAAGLTVRGHDPLVADEVIRRYGGEPVSLDKAFADADAVIVINDHPDYREIEVDDKLASSGVRVLFDSWRILDEAAVTARGVRYARHRLPHEGARVMRALLLGGAGFIGLHLAARLLEAGHEVTVVGDFSRGRRDPTLTRLASQAEIRSADLTDPASYAALEHRWDHVYMLAAVVGVRNVESDPARVIRVNTLALMHLLDWIAPPARGCSSPPPARRTRAASAPAWCPCPRRRACR